MISKEQMKEVVNTVKTTLDSELGDIVNANKGKVTADTSVEDAVNLASNMGAAIGSVLEVLEIEGVEVPKLTARFTPVEHSVTVKVSTKHKAQHPYSRETSVKVDDNFAQGVVDAYIATIIDIVYLEKARESCADFNEEIAKFFEEAEADYTLAVTIDGSYGSVIASITDDVLTLNIGVDKAFELCDIPVLAEVEEEDGYDQIVKDKAIEELMNSIKKCQTTVSFLASKPDIITDLVDLPSYRKVHKVLREKYHRKVNSLATIKEGYGYFHGDVPDGDDTINIFSVVHKGLDGNYDVILSPFNTKTLFNVDVDVLSLI